MQVSTTDDFETRKALRARLQQIKSSQRGKHEARHMGLSVIYGMRDIVPAPKKATESTWNRYKNEFYISMEEEQTAD